MLSTFVQKYEEVQSAGQIILKIISGCFLIKNEKKLNQNFVGYKEWLFACLCITHRFTQSTLK